MNLFNFFRRKKVQYYTITLPPNKLGRVAVFQSFLDYRQFISIHTEFHGVQLVRWAKRYETSEYSPYMFLVKSPVVQQHIPYLCMGDAIKFDIDVNVYKSIKHKLTPFKLTVKPNYRG